MMRTLATFLGGIVLIAVLAPLSQFLTIAVTNTDMETASPAGWAMGILFSLALGIALVRAVARIRPLSRETLVLLYCMLTIAVPVMNLGLVRPLFLSLRCVQAHFVQLFINTYRTAYQNQDPTWFPVVPTAEGLAWNKADRLLRLLRDDDAIADRGAAKRALAAILTETARTPTQSSTPDTVHAVQGLVRRLGADEIAALRETIRSSPRLAAAASALAIESPMAVRETDFRAASAAAEQRLVQTLPGIDERDVCYAPSRLSRFERNARHQLDEDRKRLAPDEVADLARRVEKVEGIFASLRTDATSLTLGDTIRLRSLLADRIRAVYAMLPEERLAAIRTSFVYRSSAGERQDLFGQNGLDGKPNQNLEGLTRGLWRRDDASRLVQDDGIVGTAREILARIPWSLWITPLLHWSFLILLAFLFLMCLAEWLRRKWIERENLAFPLVEVADHVIRHDASLETAEDIRHPAPRGRLFSGVFIAGCAIGALVYLLEALHHYRLTQGEPLLALDLSKTLFTTGAMREMGGVVFVLSPILVGLLFLVSLEISLSIWAIFLLYKFAELVARLGAGDIKDSVFTGWAGGRFFPFPMEQLLGASLCFSGILLVKAWRTRAVDTAADPANTAYLPRRLTTAGLVTIPVVIGVLLWQMGVANIPFLLVVAAVLMALTIAAARVRAETGLHTQHVTYEFSKLPMILGLTGWTGARAYTTFISLAFLPLSLLFRLLPQQLENLELARRNGVGYARLAVASLLAFVAALSAGILSFLVLNHFFGGPASGAGGTQGVTSFEGVIQYPLWVSHFLGEGGLDKFTAVHWIRVWFMVLGASVFGVLTLLRQQFLGFPLHPLGYLAILLSVYYSWVSPYYKGAPSLNPGDNTMIWGSALVAWLVKKLIIKYGGMNTYRRAKPFFVGLVAGALLCLFTVNVMHLVSTLRAAHPGHKASGLSKTFSETPPYTPQVY